MTPDMLQRLHAVLDESHGIPPIREELSIRRDLLDEDHAVMYKRLRNLLELDSVVLSRLYEFHFTKSNPNRPREFMEEHGYSSKFDRYKLPHYMFRSTSLLNESRLLNEFRNKKDCIYLSINLSWHYSYFRLSYQGFTLAIEFPSKQDGLHNICKLLYNENYVPRAPDDVESEVMEFFYDYSNIADYDE